MAIIQVARLPDSATGWSRFDTEHPLNKEIYDACMANGCSLALVWVSDPLYEPYYIVHNETVYEVTHAYDNFDKFKSLIAEAHTMHAWIPR